jgi:hypothetical protein
MVFFAPRTALTQVHVLGDRLLSKLIEHSRGRDAWQLEFSQRLNKPTDSIAQL